MNGPRSSAPHPWSLAARALSLATLALLSPAAGQAQPAEPTGVPLLDLLDKTPSEREQRLARIIDEALAAPDKRGTWRQLEAKKLVRLPAAQAALEALKKNLSIELSQHEAERVRRAILEAEAVFNPVLDLSVNYDESDTFDRKLTGTVERQAFVAVSPGPNVNDPNAGFGFITLPDAIQRRTGIRNVILDPVFEKRLESRSFIASRKQVNGPTQTFTYRAALQQQLPWGPRYSIASVTTDRDVFYDAQGHSYGASWATRLLFDLEVPVGRNFGPYSILNTQLKLSQKASESAFWALQSTINGTLLTVSLAYLDLVQAVENLLVQIDNRQLVERQSAHTRRLYEMNLATTYDRAQIEALLEGARAREEQARNAFIEASNRLAPLLEYSGKAVRNQIYLPSDYASWLEQSLALDTEKALTVALERRPELYRAEVDYAASQIQRQGAVVDARPDIRLNAQIESAQNGSAYGYKSYWESLGAISDPDTFNQSYGISYRYPWGNRAVKARLAQAEGFVQDAALARRATRNDVVREVNDALSNLATTRVRVQREEQRLVAARTAYDSIARQAESGLVNENELIINIDNLLNAKLAKIQATVDNKRAEASLLAAQGIIAAHYAGMTAGNTLERLRLQRLTETGDLQYFLR